MSLYKPQGYLNKKTHVKFVHSLNAFHHIKGKGKVTPKQAYVALRGPGG
jgi:hypothetical protein